MTGRSTLARALAATGLGAGLGVGVALVARPAQVLATVAPGYPAERLWVARVLGVRLLVQHTALLAAPRPAVLRASAAVDLVHAASMLPLVRSPRYGRAARISGGGSAARGLLTALAARRR